MLKKPKLRPSCDDAVCNLSHRDLTTEACERALGGFRAARRLDLSRNQLTALPHKTLESHLVELHVGFNCLRDIQAVAGLAHLQVLDLSYNKLDHVDVLVYCSALQTLKLQGNRLTNSRGIDGLKQLHDLDLSDNIIEA
ncbi:hypothetical protein SPRG_03593 [Saprolegnia parasitica CBS 223.65]|uniref:Uncharacterized protein n=1 Tax=Saprolegnia parasitica (strain CBS 223.65) TaxID=695850 RepID=A0A067CLY9_SAPPC|nr:hypothetical protein SPRG_03593 [Saprolegnia parasitica CBS 223.65]KDO31674.1 hypothetical protein SPRG_03593 [Saprolegnia parasitica CBS 223.65]|eukprot:XP_012197562.1 hypothetical protein SPRG_03593 [Saprolegnia parasitica CBS 223.65]